MGRRSPLLAAGLTAIGFIASAQTPASPASSTRHTPVRRLSNVGVTRAAAMVDSVFLDGTRREGRIDGGDWASYMLARLGTGPIPDSLAIEVRVSPSHIEVEGRLQDLPVEARRLLGPLASVVDSGTVIQAQVTLERTGPEVARFWLRALTVNGFPFPEFLLVPMMARVGRQYPALTASGRDLYVQVPRDATLALELDAVRLAAPAVQPAVVDTAARAPGRVPHR
jgi:hypothetical protein